MSEYIVTDFTGSSTTPGSFLYAIAQQNGETIITISDEMADQTLSLNNDVTVKASTTLALVQGMTMDFASRYTELIVDGTVNTNGAHLTVTNGYGVTVHGGGVYSQNGGSGSGVTIGVNGGGRANLFNTSAGPVSFYYQSYTTNGSYGTIADSSIGSLTVSSYSQVSVSNSTLGSAELYGSVDMQGVTVTGLLNLGNNVDVTATDLTLDNKEALRLGDISVLDSISGVTFGNASPYVGVSGTLGHDATLDTWEGVSDYRLCVSSGDWIISSGVTLDMTSAVRLDFTAYYTNLEIHGAVNTNGAHLTVTNGYGVSVSSGGVYRQTGGSGEDVNVEVLAGGRADLSCTTAKSVSFYYQSYTTNGSYGTIADSSIGSLSVSGYSQVSVSGSTLGSAELYGVVTLGST
ncbi:MAG: hypothetical protein IJS08_16035, partial [Victivallales bacterium]|nr:hypothetical protein [Victivallales bacterium]